MSDISIGRNQVVDAINLDAMSGVIDEGAVVGLGRVGEAVQRFHDGTLAIEGYTEAGQSGFEHSGGESGITSFFTYRTDGRGYVYLINSDLDEGPAAVLEDGVAALLIRQAGLR